MILHYFLVFSLYIFYLVLLFQLLRLKKVLGKHIGIFTLAILVTLIVEVSAFAGRQIFGKNPTVLFNTGIVGVTYFLLLLYFFKLTENQNLKKVQLGICMAHVINFGVSVFAKDILTVFQETTNFIGIFLLLISVAVFMIDTMNSEHILRLRSYYPFYVALSMVLIYTGLIPLIFFGPRLKNPSEAYVFQILMIIVNWIGYTGMIAGTFYAKKINKAYEF